MYRRGTNEIDPNLPVGFRFFPTEQELISFFLRHKLDRTGPDLDPVVPVVNIYDFNPWELPQMAGIYCGQDGEQQWFFFNHMRPTEANGGRPSRLTPAGYWKATGSPGHVYSADNRVIGMKRTMVFYRGRAPTGTKTEWKMNEYKAVQDDASPSTSIPRLREEFSLSRVYIKEKSPRSFDRRPTADQPNGEATTSQNRDSTMTNGMVDGTTSSQSSSSGDSSLPYQPTESSSSDMCDGNGALWEWEQLNWF